MKNWLENSLEPSSPHRLLLGRHQQAIPRPFSRGTNSPVNISDITYSKIVTKTQTRPLNGMINLAVPVTPPLHRGTVLSGNGSDRPRVGPLYKRDTSPVGEPTIRRYPRGTPSPNKWCETRWSTLWRGMLVVRMSRGKKAPRCRSSTQSTLQSFSNPLFFPFFLPYLHVFFHKRNNLYPRAWLQRLWQRHQHWSLGRFL